MHNRPVTAKSKVNNIGWMPDLEGWARMRFSHNHRSIRMTDELRWKFRLCHNDMCPNSKSDITL